MNQSQKKKHSPVPFDQVMDDVGVTQKDVVVQYLYSNPGRNISLSNFYGPFETMRIGDLLPVSCNKDTKVALKSIRKMNGNDYEIPSLNFKVRVSRRNPVGALVAVRMGDSVGIGYSLLHPNDRTGDSDKKVKSLSRYKAFHRALKAIGQQDDGSKLPRSLKDEMSNFEDKIVRIFKLGHGNCVFVYTKPEKESK